LAPLKKYYWLPLENLKNPLPGKKILPTPMTEYVPEEAARRAGGNCGPQRED